MFPEEDVDSAFIDKIDSESTATKNGEIVRWTVRAAGEDVDLSTCIGFDFAAMDAWYEEAEQLLGHPRDPFTRIDIRRSPIRAQIDGVTIAESSSPFFLTETGLGLRFYIPTEDVGSIKNPVDRIRGVIPR